MTNLTEYEKGCSPSSIQRKYSLTYEQGYELAENLRELEEENAKLKELLKECRKSFNKLKGDTVWYPYEVDECIAKIDEVLK